MEKSSGQETMSCMRIFVGNALKFIPQTARCVLARSVACAAAFAIVMQGHAADVATAGSGCFIGTNLVLTAYHVIDGCSKIRVAVEDGDWMDATYVNGDKGMDWAVLKVSVGSETVVSVADKSFDLGSRVYALGFPSASILGWGLKYADGVVSSLSGLAGDANKFQMTIPIQPGNSGGPIFDERHQLVGVVSSTIDPGKFYSITGGALPQNLNFAVPVARIPIAVIHGKERSLKENKRATCFIKCVRPSSESDNVKNNEENRDSSSKDTHALKKLTPVESLGDGYEHVGITDISKLFGFQLGESYPFLQKYRVFENDNTIACLFRTRKPFLGFSNIFAEISKKTSTLISLHAYTDEYKEDSFALFRGMNSRCEDDALRAVRLIEEKFGITMQKVSTYRMTSNGRLDTPIPDRLLAIGKVDESEVYDGESIPKAYVSDFTPLHRRGVTTSVDKLWRYVSWPNYYNSNSYYRGDPHHMVTVIVFDRLSYNEAGVRYKCVWISLRGTAENLFAAEECGAKEREQRRRQEALDAL